MYKAIIKYPKLIFQPIIFLIGIINYTFTKKNYEIFYQAFVITHCVTSGLINSLISKLITLFSEKQKSLINKDEIEINHELTKNGYTVISELQNSKIISEIFQLTKTLGCFSRSDPEKKIQIYNNLDIKFPSYNYMEKDLISQEVILKIVKNEKFTAIARNYFGCEPYLKGVGMWWSTDILKQADSDSAQMFHFDLDAIKWLKIFIYITDVDLNNGPHVYVAKTHKPFGKSYDLLMRGYKRIPDKDIKERYDESEIITLCGKSGTTIIGDTNCFHKGLPPKNGKRLIFEYQLSNSLFGSPETEDFKDLKSNKTFLDYSKNSNKFFKKYI